MIDIRFKALNIVNQIGDKWYSELYTMKWFKAGKALVEEWVEMRQRTNDELDHFVAEIIRDVAERAWTEGRESVGHDLLTPVRSDGIRFASPNPYTPLTPEERKHLGLDERKS